MKLIKWKGKALRAVAFTLAILLILGTPGTAALHALAAESIPSNVIRDSGTGTPTHLDFENPPPIPEGFTSGGAAEDVDVLGEENDQFVEQIAVFLAKALAEWAIEKAVDYAAKDMLDAMFGNEYQEKISEIINNNNLIIDRLERIINTVKMMDYKEIITTKTHKMNDLWNKFVVKQSTLSKEMSAKDRMKELQMYFDGSDSNYVLDVIDYYTTYVEGNAMLDGSVFTTYDGYALYNYYWENEGYDFRASTRALDVVYFVQMWVLAYAACQAHIDGNTDDQFEAQAAQTLLLDCISMPIEGRTPDVTGIFSLLEQSPITHLKNDYYTFQVPGHEMSLWIPKQTPGPLLDVETLTKASRGGWGAHPLLERKLSYFSGKWSDDRSFATYDKHLSAIKDYYHLAGKDMSVRQILHNITEDEAYISDDFKKTGFLLSTRYKHWPIDNKCWSFAPWLAEASDTVGLPVTFALNRGFDPNSPIDYAVRDDGILSRIFRVFLADNHHTGQEEPEIISNEMTDSGVVTAVGESMFTLTLDGIQTPQPFNEQVLIGPETRMSDGSPVDLSNLQALMNCKVEVSGTYTYADGTLAAKSITVKDASGTQTVSGTVVSSAANAVIVLEDGTRATNGYFLPNVQGDVPTGSHITIKMHWENGVKTVDSYELQENPGPTPEPDPTPGPTPEPTPEPTPDPVDGPITSDPSPLAG